MTIDIPPAPKAPHTNIIKDTGLQYWNEEDFLKLIEDTAREALNNPQTAYVMTSEIEDIRQMMRNKLLYLLDSQWLDISSDIDYWQVRLLNGSVVRICNKYGE